MIVVFALSNETCIYLRVYDSVHVKGGNQARPYVNEGVSLNMGAGTGEMAHQLRALAALPEDQVWFSAPTWQLITSCSVSSKEGI